MMIGKLFFEAPYFFFQLVVIKLQTTVFRRSNSSPEAPLLSCATQIPKVSFPTQHIDPEPKLYAL